MISSPKARRTFRQVGSPQQAIHRGCLLFLARRVLDELFSLSDHQLSDDSSFLGGSKFSKVRRSDQITLGPARVEITGAFSFGKARIQGLKNQCAGAGVTV